MAFVKSQDLQHYIFSADIYLGAFFGKEEKEIYIKVREPNTEQYQKINKVQVSKDEELILNTIIELLPNLIVESNFYEDEKQTKKMDKTEIVDLIKDNLKCTAYVIEHFINDIVFFSQNKK